MSGPAGKSTPSRFLIGTVLGFALLILLIVSLKRPRWSGEETEPPVVSQLQDAARTPREALPEAAELVGDTGHAPEDDATRSTSAFAIPAQTVAPFEFALLPPPDGFGGQPIVYIGMGRLSEIDWQEYLIASAEGAAGAGPESIAELSHVSEWHVMEPMQRAGFIYTVQPTVETGSHYVHLLAISTDRRWWYEAQAPMARVATGGRLEVNPRGVTGILLTIDPPPSQPAQATFNRLQARGGRLDGQLTLLQELVVPELYDAHRGEAGFLFDGTGPHLLAPLHGDGAVALRFRTLTGRPLETETIALREGELIPHTIAIEPEAGKLADLNGLIVEAGTGTPVEGVTVWAQLDPDLYRSVSDDAGTFLIEHLEAGMEYGFELRFPEPEAGRRPTFPDQLVRTVSIPPSDALNEGRHEVVWEIPSYRWLVLELPGAAESLTAVPMSYPFPVYILNRLRNDGSEWRPRRADHFISEGREVSVSIEEEGAYSVRVALSPLEYLESDVATFGPGDLEQRVGLDRRASPRSSELVVRAVNGDGQAWVGAQLRVLAPIGLPFPVVKTTDKDGMAKVGWASHGELHFELEFGDGRDYVLKQGFAGEAVLELVFDDSTLLR